MKVNYRVNAKLSFEIEAEGQKNYLSPLPI